MGAGKEAGRQGGMGEREHGATLSGRIAMAYTPYNISQFWGSYGALNTLNVLEFYFQNSVLGMYFLNLLMSIYTCTFIHGINAV